MADQPVTREKLINADIDVDNLGKAVNEKGVVTPRYGDPYPTLPSAIQVIIESGGFEPFETEAILLESSPTLEKKAAYALDTHKIFLWEDGVWADTGESAIDQAKKFANIAEENAAQTTDKKLNQLFVMDFHSEDGFSLVVIDQNNYMVSGIRDNQLVSTGADEFIKDFHSEKYLVTFLIVDKNLNILNNGQASSGLDTSKLQNFAFYPGTLNSGDVYSDFGTLKVQKDWESDLYKFHANDVITNHQTAYQFYDQLVTQNPAVFFGEVIGVDGLGNEIKQYTYTPRVLMTGTEDVDSSWSESELAPPKIVITTGVHGDEKEAILQLIIFMNELFNRYTEIEEAALLRQARLVIVPCITPSAINQTKRTNHNGVNVNRNARSGFAGDGGTALSQPECAIAVDLPNQHPDAACFVDFHNYHASGMTTWLSTHGLGNSFKILKKIAHELNIMTPARFPFLASRPVRLGKNANGTIARDWQLISNKKAYLIETSNDEGVFPSFELRQHGLYVLRTALSEIYKDEVGV